MDYELLEIDDYRLALPLNYEDEDAFPLGLALNYNAKTKLEFVNYEKPAPLVFILSDNGVLNSFFAINTRAETSINQEAKQMPFIQIQQQLPPAPQQQQQQQPQLQLPIGQNQIGKSMAFGAGLNFGQSVQPSVSLFGPNPPKPETTETQSIKFDLTPQQQTSLFPKPAMQAQPQQPQNGFPGFGAQTQFKFSSSAQPQPQVQIPQPNKAEADLKLKQQLETQKQQSEAQKQQQQQQQIQQQIKPATSQVPSDELKSDSLNRITAFDKEITELKQNVEKLFKNGKDLKKCLTSLTVIKETKLTQENYQKLNEAMKELAKNCANLETDLLSDFHCYEKLKVQVRKESETKFSGLSIKAEFDPAIMNKFENCKKLYSYLQRELTQMSAIIMEKQKQRKDKMATCIPLDEIYETIKSIDVNVKYHNERVNKIIEHMKFVKMGRRVLNEINSSYSPSRFHATTAQQVGANAATSESNNDENLSFDLTQEISQLRIKPTNSPNEDEEIEKAKNSDDFQTKFYSQLRQLLRKRKKIPSSNLSLNKIELKEEKYSGTSTSTQVVVEDSSFLSTKPVEKQETVAVIKPPLTNQKSVVPEVSKVTPAQQEAAKSVPEAPIKTAQKQQFPAQIKPETAPKPGLFSSGTAAAVIPPPPPTTNQPIPTSTPLFPALKNINPQLSKIMAPATPPHSSQVVTSTPATNAPVSFNISSPVPFPKSSELSTAGQSSTAPATTTTTAAASSGIQKSLFGNLAQPQGTSLFGAPQLQQQQQQPIKLSFAPKQADAAIPTPTTGSLFGSATLPTTSAQPFSFNLNKPQAQLVKQTETVSAKPDSDNKATAETVSTVTSKEALSSETTKVEEPKVEVKPTEETKKPEPPITTEAAKPTISTSATFGGATSKLPTSTSLFGTLTSSTSGGPFSFGQAPSAQAKPFSFGTTFGAQAKPSTTATTSEQKPEVKEEPAQITQPPSQTSTDSSATSTATTTPVTTPGPQPIQPQPTTTATTTTTPAAATSQPTQPPSGIPKPIFGVAASATPSATTQPDATQPATQQPKPAVSFFGAPATTAATTAPSATTTTQAGFSFGSQPTATATATTSGGGLFGMPAKPATATTTAAGSISGTPMFSGFLPQTGAAASNANPFTTLTASAQPKPAQS